MAEFYDFQEILQTVSIEDVCNYYGIELKGNGNQRQGSIRSEKEASCSFRLREGTLNDFGIHLNGNIFALVAYMELGIISSNEHKLSKEQQIEVSRIIGRNFGVKPKTYQKENGVWYVPRDKQFETIGLFGDRAIKNMIDLTKQSIGQANAIEAKYGDMSMKDLFNAYPKSYYYIVVNKSLPYMYKEKQKYLNSVTELARAKKNNADNVDELFERAEKLYTEYSKKYNMLKGAIPPLSEAEKKATGKNYAVNTAPYNVYPVAEELARYVGSKESNIQIGSVEYSTLMNYAKKNGEDIARMRLSKDVDLSVLNSLNIQYAGFDKGLNNETVLCLRGKDVWTVQNALHTDFSLVNFDSDLENVKQNKGQLSRFGKYLKSYLIQSEGKNRFGYKSLSDVAKDMNLDVRRISEILRANAKLSPAQAELLTTLKYKFNYNDDARHTVELTHDKEIRRFTELSPKEQNSIIHKVYDSPKNIDATKEGGRKFTLEQLENNFKACNNKYGFNRELKRVSLNEAIKDNTHNLSYINLESLNTIKSESAKYKLNPYYIPICKPKEELKNMLQQMDKEGFLYSGIADKGNVVKLTIVNTEEAKNKFMQYAVKEGVIFDAKKTPFLYERQERVRQNMNCEQNNAYIPQQAGRGL